MKLRRKLRRLRITVSGQVQGVGFRPTVYRLASNHKLTGFVRNTSSGVIIEVQGETSRIENFLKQLKNSPPSRAKIKRITVKNLPVEKEEAFLVLESQESQNNDLEIPPDIATCSQCQLELLSPLNRRHLHPFISCPDCGPRYTIIKKIPYDRVNTTMAEFPLCKTCGKEYENPRDRRFHTQPLCCHNCGPQLVLIDSAGRKKLGNSSQLLKETAGLLREGKILAIKGLGGFHLACDATNQVAVDRLRQRKHREEKPLAVMADCLKTIKRYCQVSRQEAEILCSWQSPIVLLRKKKNCPLPENIAPNNRFLGFLLPYTPVHHLLFHLHCPEVLVMTSGNFSEEPILYEDEPALEKLKGVADFFLTHNRKIQLGCDDSVLWVNPETKREVFIRRSRGYAPSSLALPFSSDYPVLGCGGQMKNTFALVLGNRAIVSQHIGDLENLPTYKFYTFLVNHLERLFGIQPDLVAYDLHPDYFSTKYAQERINQAGLTGLAIQHHHGHIAACLAENKVAGRKVIGVAFDGTGWGEDGTVWGAEFLVADYAGYKRVAHLLPVALPGGEKAIREPWRMAAVYLQECFGQEMFRLKIDFVRQLDRKIWQPLQVALKENINCPRASSLGRLFDGVASLLGLRQVSRFEGQPAMDLENITEEKKGASGYPFTFRELSGTLIIDWRPLIQGIVESLLSHQPKATIAWRFHETIGQMVLQACQRISKETGLKEVALSGGCFQNRILTLRCEKILKMAGFTVYTHRLLPPNDGCLSLGQAVVAASRIAKTQPKALSERLR
ncbi:MAG: carbamoyltransferase HypF [Candidatus Omnitrophica bacterium]|nr:carbamoyltransferase HypF [Candidatus Omnitrophota bacterium]